MTIALIIIAIVFSVISGFAKAICDLSEGGKLKLKPKDYWVKSSSWVRKWKTESGDFSEVPIRDKDGKYIEKFFGSSRWFVALTDAWHLFGLIERIGFVITYTLTGILIKENIWFLFLLLNYPLSMLVFHIFYNSKLLRK